MKSGFMKYYLKIQIHTLCITYLWFCLYIYINNGQEGKKFVERGKTS